MRWHAALNIWLRQERINRKGVTKVKHKLYAVDDEDKDDDDMDDDDWEDEDEGGDDDSE